ncbi:MAG: hypothetical protein ACE5GQ_09580 [Nitrospinales bacterium]
MKHIFKIAGWIFLGIILQFKFNVLYGIVYLENLNFHDRAYITKMKSTPTGKNVQILHVETIVHHSLGADYFSNVYIPDGYNVLNRVPYGGAEPIPGYKPYQMDMKRKYRDVLAKADFIIVPAQAGMNFPPAPIIVHYENMKQLLHKDSTYLLSTKGDDTQLEGPVLVEATFPQKLGM